MPVRFVQLLVLAATLLPVSGCRPKDPLDWRVEGRNAALLQNWIDETLAELPPPLAQEFGEALLTIRDNTRGWKTAELDSSLNPLCMRLKDRTIRDVTIEGLQLVNDHRTSRIKNDLDQIVRLVDSMNAATDAQGSARVARRIAALEQRIALEKSAVAMTERRISDLRNGSAAPAPSTNPRKDL